MLYFYAHGSTWWAIYWRQDEPQNSSECVFLTNKKCNFICHSPLFYATFLWGTRQNRLAYYLVSSKHIVLLWQMSRLPMCLIPTPSVSCISQCTCLSVKVSYGIQLRVCYHPPQTVCCSLHMMGYLL